MTEEVVALSCGGGVRANRPARRGLAALLAAGVCALVVSGCARPAPRVAPGPPKYPQFTVPHVPEDLQRLGAAARGHRTAWALLQSGDLRAANRGFASVVQRQPSFYPAIAGAGYVALAEARHDEALRAFDRALGNAPAYVPALLGRGEALLALRRDADALAAFDAALAADPSLTDVRRRVDVLRFRGVQNAIGAAQAAAREGRLEDARAAYERAIAASPDSGFLYRELAAVEQRLGAADAALAHVRAAIARDPADPASQVLLGELLEAAGDWDGALAAYSAARTIDPTPEIEDRIARLRERVALARLPAEYQAIHGAERVTRADLAALLGVRLEALVRAVPGADAVLITDARGSWAQPWIASVARAGFMEVYSNHTFQPRAAVRRGDLAHAASRVLGALAAQDPELARTLASAEVRFTDVGPGHLSYRAAAAAVAAGIMEPVEGGAFRPSRPVSGAEAIAAVDRLQSLAARSGSAASR